MGELELGHLYVHPVLWNSPRNGRPHLQSEICKFGYMDARTNAGITSSDLSSATSSFFRAYVLKEMNGGRTITRRTWRLHLLDQVRTIFFSVRSGFICPKETSLSFF